MNDRFSRLLPYLRATLSLIGLAGAGMCIVALAGDWFGLGAQPGFGLRQLAALIMGLLVMLWAGVLLLDLRLHPGTDTATARSIESGRGHEGRLNWPTSKEVALAFGLSLLATAVDIHFSQQLGLLAYPPMNDGVYYLLVAKGAFHRLPDVASNPLALTRSLLDNRFPAFQGLLLFHYVLLGEGEWQSYAVRFWPMFLLSLLVFWVVRRRADTRMAAAATLFTTMLPALSNGLRSSTAQYFGHLGFGQTWYMADLRPDLLFAVLLLWAVVFLVEHAQAVSRRVWLVSAAFAALAVLTKASALPVLLLAWGSAIVYVLIVNRDRLWYALRTSVWGAAAFAFLLAPWVLAGGATLSLEYLYLILTVHRISYSNPNATLLSEASYYWTLFPRHMGVAEGWILLGLGLLGWLWLARKRFWDEWSPLLAYVVVSGVLYGLVSLTSAKNYHLGLPYYLMLWVFSWSALSTTAKKMALNHRAVSRMVLLVAILYGATVVGLGLYALWNIPSEQRLDGSQSRQTTLQIAADLRAHLANEDTFAWVPAYGFPNTLQYYMVDSSGGYPQSITIDATALPPVDEYLRTVDRCKAILVYEEDMEQVSQHQFTWTPRANWPYMRAIHDWVKQPDSPYRLVGTYYLYDRTGPTFPRLTLQLYVRQPQEAASETR